MPGNHDYWTSGGTDCAPHAAGFTLAYWHQPYYTGAATPVAAYKAFWQILAAAHADVVLAGHVHTCARFAPQNASGAVDRTHGMREFIVGTGGDSIGGALGSTNIEANTRAFGVLKLTLHPTSYDWRFVTIAGATADSGTTACS